jgi:hypothetical protein
LLGIACIVFGQQLELDGFATDLDALGVEFFNGQDGCVFVVLAQVGDGAADGADVTDLDDFLGHQLGGANGQCSDCNMFHDDFHQVIS